MQLWLGSRHCITRERERYSERDSRAAGAGGRVALAPRAATPAVLPAARHRAACLLCVCSAAVVQRARGLVLPMLLPMAPQVRFPRPVSSLISRLVAKSVRCIIQLDHAGKIRSTAWPPVQGQTVLMRAAAACRRADQSVQLAEQDVEAGHAGQAEQVEHAGQAGQARQGPHLDRSSVSLQLGACLLWAVRPVCAAADTTSLPAPATVRLPAAGCQYLCSVQCSRRQVHMCTHLRRVRTS